MGIDTHYRSGNYFILCWIFTMRLNTCRVQMATAQSRRGDRPKREQGTAGNDRAGCGRTCSISPECPISPGAFSPVDNCQQSQMEVKMMQWPNMYSNTNGWKGSGW